MAGSFIHFIVLQAITTSTLLLRSVAQNVSLAVDPDALDPLQTCNRGYGRMVVVDNIVYIYGGVSIISNGTTNTLWILNRYLRIVDLSTTRNLSDPSLITAEPLPDFVPTFDEGAFWEDGRKLYVVAGLQGCWYHLTEQGSFVDSDWSLADLSGQSIYYYDVDLGQWSVDTALQNYSQTGLPMDGTFSWNYLGWNSRLAIGYVHNGIRAAGHARLNPNTDVYTLDPGVPQIGEKFIASFNTSDWTWTNKTISSELVPEWSERGNLVFLPGTESNTGGLAVALGGDTRPETQYLSLRRVVMYDTGADEWFEQDTTAEGGTYPAPRASFCAVAMSAADGSSHNIYVYGGLQASSDDALGDIWILTLPAFHWIPVSTSSVPRSAPACAVVADRYLVTYGGMYQTIEWPIPARYDWPCDQAQSGLRLFDLTHLNWTSTYEAPPQQSSVTPKSPTTSNLYAIPSQVYSIIGGDAGGGATVTAPSTGFGTNTALASIFANAVKVSSSSSSTASVTATATSAGSTTGSHSSHSHAGAIAGGVVGGVAGLVIILIAGLWFVRRRRRMTSTPDAREVSKGPHEVDGISLRKVDSTGKYEVDGNARHEADGSERQEAGESERREVDGRERYEADGMETARPASLLTHELEAPIR
ncbi:uncharacterized protein Z520_06824 [Fonsecaea multimorphosa CBS 102226]|uniref:Kelch repeat protein n=1 Tax=Fonsecaea multimorphosa CBS 102226 TaxID=1442371 RepID=A0A0D2JV63_9EURO|nr:uncharacterized protein Z520_06824 [Fonsecaea multimorphosa CBS 102226]KIX97372.1 hypothetical protein Z520_06824 [Fonsecaea multimorphosa CBS 102226]OAL23339.1 hypothetical protein AYO22_06389 [Fonsecaea multimorphosa]